MAFQISKRVRTVSKRSRRRLLVAESLESRAMLTTFYVSGYAGLPGPGDGSIDAPFATINQGVAAAMQNSEADEIVLTARVTGAPYDETVTFFDKGPDRSAITLRGVTGDRADVRLTSGNGAAIIADAPIDLTIQDLTIHNPFGAGIRVNDGDVTVDNVRVTGSISSSGITHQHGNLTVRDSVLEDNYQGLWSAELTNSSGTVIAYPENLTVENTITTNNQAHGILTRRSTGNVIIRDVDASNNRMNGIVIDNNLSARLEDVTLSNNGRSGAAIIGTDSVSIIGIESANNLDSGLWVSQSDSLSIRGGELLGNGVVGAWINDSTALTLSDVVVSDNVEGGIRIYRADGVSIDRAMVTGNGSMNSNVTVGGGGIHIDPATSAAIAISNSRVSDNETRGNGGGIEIWAFNYPVNHQFTSNLTISNTVVTGNQIAPDVYRHGGGIALFGPIAATLDEVVISGNTSRGTAGLHAYSNFASIDGPLNLSVSDSTISGNVALREGPGIGAGAAGLFHGGGEIHVSGTTVSGNDGGNAGGIYLQSSVGDITNSTISGNTGVLTGGLVSTGGPGALTLRHLTIVDNYGANTGGISSNTSQLQIGNSVVANNTSGDLFGGPNAVPSRNMAGSMTSLHGNFFAEAVYVNILGGGQDQIGTLNAPLDPVLGPLQDNGGATWTHAPLAGSPLVDAGNDVVAATLLVDQRGQERRQGDAVDVGAVEQTVDAVDVLAKHPEINLNSVDRSNKSVELVLHSTAEFDVSLVDVATISWASAMVHNSWLRDVDGDGDLDLILQFKLRETDLVDRYRDLMAADDSSNRKTVAVELTGKTRDGLRVEGNAEVELRMTGRSLRELQQPNDSGLRHSLRDRILSEGWT